MAWMPLTLRRNPKAKAVAAANYSRACSARLKKYSVPPLDLVAQIQRFVRPQ